MLSGDIPASVTVNDVNNCNTLLHNIKRKLSKATCI